jgi:DNA-binding NtrC family response regulator
MIMVAKAKDKKILIVDEHRFSRICSAILMSGGYKTDVVSHTDDLSEKLVSGSICLIVTSYPFGAALFELLQKKKIPIIILSDGIDERLMNILSNFQNSCCMIKPVDYDRFKIMVKRAVEGSFGFERGYTIV